MPTLDTFLDELDRMFWLDQELEDKGVSPEDPERQQLAARMEACEVQIAAIMAAQPEPVREDPNITMTLNALARRNALCRRIN